MSIKAKAPPVDPETKARQEAAEKRAEAGRIEATQDNLSQDTRAVLRNFGRLQGGAGGDGPLASLQSILPAILPFRSLPGQQVAAPQRQRTIAGGVAR